MNVKEVLVLYMLQRFDYLLGHRLLAVDSGVRIIFIAKRRILLHPRLCHLTSTGKRKDSSFFPINKTPYTTISSSPEDDGESLLSLRSCMATVDTNFKE